MEKTICNQLQTLSNRLWKILKPCLNLLLIPEIHAKKVLWCSFSGRSVASGIQKWVIIGCKFEYLSQQCVSFIRRSYIWWHETYSDALLEQCFVCSSWLAQWVIDHQVWYDDFDSRKSLWNFLIFDQVMRLRMKKIDASSVPIALGFRWRFEGYEDKSQLS